MKACIDLPRQERLNDPLSLFCQGWFHAGEKHPGFVRALALLDGIQIGATELLYERPDVNAALGLAAGTRTGFSLLCAAPALIGLSQARLSVVAEFSDGASETAAETTVTLARRDYRTGDWGSLLEPNIDFLVKREHMYNSGPSLALGNEETLMLLRRYLPPAPARVLDIGCGLGFYGRRLIEAGYAWQGVEVKVSDVEALQREGLPGRLVDASAPLPWETGHFDAALAVEVLEHVVDPEAFVKEARRVSKGPFVVSVPNLEVVTYWRDHLAVPWHLLEIDHRSFFSRASLAGLLRRHFSRVEVISYGQAPLPSPEGAPLGYHLLGVAW